MKRGRTMKALLSISWNTHALHACSWRGVAGTAGADGSRTGNSALAVLYTEMRKNQATWPAGPSCFWEVRSTARASLSCPVGAHRGLLMSREGGVGMGPKVTSLPAFSLAFKDTVIACGSMPVPMYRIPFLQKFKVPGFIWAHSFPIAPGSSCSLQGVGQKPPLGEVIPGKEKWAFCFWFWFFSSQLSS